MSVSNGRFHINVPFSRRLAVFRHFLSWFSRLGPTRVKDFKQYACAHAQEYLVVETGPQRRCADGAASLRSAQADTVRLLESDFGPFGQGHSEPLFALQGVRVEHVDILKEQHVKLSLVDVTGGKRLKAMMFRAAGTPLGQALMAARGQSLDIVGKFTLNEWQGRVSAEFLIEDAGPAG